MVILQTIRDQWTFHIQDDQYVVVITDLIIPIPHVFVVPTFCREIGMFGPLPAELSPACVRRAADRHRLAGLVRLTPSVPAQLSPALLATGRAARPRPLTAQQPRWSPPHRPWPGSRLALRIYQLYTVTAAHPRHISWLSPPSRFPAAGKTDRQLPGWRPSSLAHVPSARP